jgi:hypothetical protein
MNPEALLSELEQEPFVPLRLHLSGGRKADITDSISAVVANLSVYVFRISRVHRRLADDTQLISLRHIVSVERVVAQGNGR